MLFIGATGAGKSSTIMELFRNKPLYYQANKRPKIGLGAKPQTQEIAKYKLDRHIIYDSPGLGDSEKNDRRHIKIIRKILPQIDLLVLVINASSRDLAGSFKIFHLLQNDFYKYGLFHILIAINQADRADQNNINGFDYKKNKPSVELRKYLKNFRVNIKKRILKELKTIDLKKLILSAVCYVAGYTDKNGIKHSGYNIKRLKTSIVKAHRKNLQSRNEKK